MVLYAEGIDYGIVLMNGAAQEFVETVCIYAFAGGGAVETAHTATQEGIFADVNNIAPIGETKVAAVIFNELMGGCIVEMFGSRYLGCDLAAQVCTGFFQQLNETMKLIWNKESINRITEEKNIRFLKELDGRGKIPFQRLYCLPGIQISKVNFRKFLLQIQTGVEGGGIVSLGTSIDG